MYKDRIVTIKELSCDFCESGILEKAPIVIDIPFLEARFHYCSEDCFWAHMTTLVGHNRRSICGMLKTQEIKEVSS